MKFPTCGSGPKEWTLSDTQVSEWQEAYPHIDVLLECKKARVWLLANHLKTAKGMPRFLVNWLNRAADSYVKPKNSPVQKADTVVKLWSCPHVDRCSNAWQCRDAKVLGRPEKVAS